MPDSNIISENNLVHSIPKEVHESFNIIFKIGIYKELHHKHLLSDEQLNQLICQKQ